MVLELGDQGAVRGGRQNNFRFIKIRPPFYVASRKLIVSFRLYLGTARASNNELKEVCSIRIDILTIL